MGLLTVFKPKWEVYTEGTVIPDYVVSVHYSYSRAKEAADKKNWTRFLKGLSYENFEVYLVRRRLDV